MTTTTDLIKARRFLPLFVTQLLGAFNDNLFKNAMVLFVVYSVYNSESEEAHFSAIASTIFVIPFFLLSALAGQLAPAQALSITQHASPENACRRVHHQEGRNDK